MKTKKILFVDDEKYILRNFKKLLKSEPYQGFYVGSAQETLTFLEENTVDVIVVDSRMPEMNGIDLLIKIRALHPEIVRVALCGFSESRSIQKIVEKDVAKLFLFKPWDDDEMLKNIRGILEMRFMLMNQYLLELIEKLETLPSLPRVYYDITDLIEKGADIAEVANIVKKDQAISSKVLKMANSAFYGRKTGDLNQAIMGIGLNNLKMIILSTSLFAGPSDLMEEIEILWQHAVNTNKLTHLLYSELLNKKMPAVYGSAGLLHDIGKLILHVFYQKTYQKILEESKDGEQSLIEHEMHAFHVSHQDLGGYLLNGWELPYAYVEAAMFHHRPTDQRVINTELVAVVHLANYYSIMRITPDETINYLDPSVFKKLKVSQGAVEALIDEFMNSEHLK